MVGRSWLVGRLALPRPVVAVVMAAALALEACNPASPAQTLRLSSPGEAGGSIPASASPNPGESPRTFDPTAISITLRSYASVPGGPLAIVAPHDGSGRLFVASQDGRAWVVNRDGTTRARPLLDLSGQITTGGERGLL